MGNCDGCNDFTNNNNNNLVLSARSLGNVNNYKYNDPKCSTPLIINTISNHIPSKYNNGINCSFTPSNPTSSINTIRSSFNNCCINNFSTSNVHSYRSNHKKCHDSYDGHGGYGIGIGYGGHGIGYGGGGYGGYGIGYGGGYGGHGGGYGGHGGGHGFGYY